MALSRGDNKAYSGCDNSILDYCGLYRYNRFSFSTDIKSFDFINSLKACKDICLIVPKEKIIERRKQSGM